MQFENLGHESVRLLIKGYEFPNISNNKYDSNWLNIEIDVVHKRGNWKASSACLLTWEVERLAQWFEHIEKGNVTETTQDFLESGLYFLLVDVSGKLWLHIYFELELRPSWVSHSEDLWVQIPISNINWNLIIASIHKSLRQFPYREGI